MYPRKFFYESLFAFLMTCFHNVRSTEISETSASLYKYLDIEIELPNLLCHARHTGYKTVIWKKDDITVKKGPNNIRSHTLSLKSILDSNLTSLDNPFKLQGYYWCETDVSTSAYIHSYLFQIPNIHTFVGKLVSVNDSLGSDNKLSMKKKLSWKMRIYEKQMQYVIFRTYPRMNLSVTDMEVLHGGGLEVRFYLYVRELHNPRRKPDYSLEQDEFNLLDIEEYLANLTSSTAEIDYSKDWVDLLGIKIKDIEVRSTLGCYRETYLLNTTEEVVWPEARIGDVVIPENACLSRNGFTVTRVCTGDFYTGAKWGEPSGKCERPAGEITLQIKDIYDNYGRTLEGYKIEKLIELTSYPSVLGVSDLHIIADILNHLSEAHLNPKEINGMLSVIDNLMETNKTELVAAKSIIRLTSRFLRILNNILKKANSERKEIRVSMRHLMVDTKFTEEIDAQNPVLGLAVTAPNIRDSLLNGSVEFLYSDKLPKMLHSVAHFCLPKELVLDRISKEDVPSQVNMVFFQNWDLFQNPKDVLVKRNYRVLPTPVMQISVSGGPAWNLTDPVQLYFKDTVKEEIENPVCVFYDSRLDDGVGAWSSEGCEYKGLNHGYYHCQCHHLSIFAVILSKSPYSTKDFKLGTPVYVACGFSMIALLLVVLLFILSKHWRKTVDHSILFCLSLTFLVCIMIIFISEIDFKPKLDCVALAMVFHYTIFATFGWLMVLAVIYRLRFAKKTDVSEIPHFTIKAALSVWGMPIIIIMIMWITKDFPYSAENSCWIAVYEVAKVSTIPSLILINITLCINFCATYSLTCRFKKDFLVGDTQQYNDVAVKFRVGFTIFSFFVLCWLFGFLALHKRSSTFRILFNICITLTAYYVSLFFIFQEISFWDLCTNCKGKEDETTPVAQYTASKTYKSEGETNVKK